MYIHTYILYIHTYLPTYIHTYVRMYMYTYENTYALNSKLHILREVVTERTVATIRHKPSSCALLGSLATYTSQTTPASAIYVRTYVPPTVLCTSLGVEHMIQPSRSRFMRIPDSCLWHQSKCVGPSSLFLGILLRFGLGLLTVQDTLQHGVCTCVYVLAAEMRRIFPCPLNEKVMAQCPSKSNVPICIRYSHAYVRMYVCTYATQRSDVQATYIHCICTSSCTLTWLSKMYSS